MKQKAIKTLILTLSGSEFTDWNKDQTLLNWLPELK